MSVLHIVGNCLGENALLLVTGVGQVLSFARLQPHWGHGECTTHSLCCMLKCSCGISKIDYITRSH